MSSVLPFCQPIPALAKWKDFLKRASCYVPRGHGICVPVPTPSSRPPLLPASVAVLGFPWYHPPASALTIWHLKEGVPSTGTQGRALACVYPPSSPPNTLLACPPRTPHPESRGHHMPSTPDPYPLPMQVRGPTLTRWWPGPSHDLEGVTQHTSPMCLSTTHPIPPPCPASGAAKLSQEAPGVSADNLVPIVAGRGLGDQG